MLFYSFTCGFAGGFFYLAYFHLETLWLSVLGSSSLKCSLEELQLLFSVRLLALVSGSTFLPLFDLSATTGLETMACDNHTLHPLQRAPICSYDLLMSCKMNRKCSAFPVKCYNEHHNAFDDVYKA